MVGAAGYFCVAVCGGVLEQALGIVVLHRGAE